jgi:hypothetical protein
MNEQQFARAMRFHLAQHDGGHSVDTSQLAHLDADGLNERHKRAHAEGEYIDPEHSEPAALHAWFRPKHADPNATAEVPMVGGAADDAREAAGVALWAGGRPQNLAAVIERLSGLDGDMTELAKAVGRDMQRVSDQVAGMQARLSEVDVAKVPAPAGPALDLHALAALRGLLSAVLMQLGAVSYRHTVTSAWPERGTARAEAVVRDLHRMAAIMDGMADGAQALNGNMAGQRTLPVEKP